MTFWLWVLIGAGALWLLVSAAIFAALIRSSQLADAEEKQARELRAARRREREQV